MSWLPAFEKLLEEIDDQVRSAYGDRLVSLVVYGSVGRRTPRPDSDVDLLLVAREIPDGRTSRMEQFTELVEKPLAPFLSDAQKNGADTFLSCAIKTPDEVQAGSPLFLDMTEDARILFDRDGFFADYLEGLRGRLRGLGSRRIWRGNAWFWDLKPDFKPGDKIEL